MSQINATIAWQRLDGAPFTDNRYSRVHSWQFDGGQHLKASASPHFVPEPASDARLIDPEEAFVAALSSCHMLTVLAMIAKAGFVVEDYQDQAVGVMAHVEGVLQITRITLNPRITYVGEVPSHEQEEQLHHKAHRQCIIANSVNTEVAICLS